MSEIFIGSDYHFSHKNILKYDRRPFETVREMNEVMIERHNEVVRPNDRVYCVGDFCFGGTHEWSTIRKRLNGDWHLISGNHDRQSFHFLRSTFSSVHEIIEIKLGKHPIILSHFPLYTWNKSHYGSYHCHGHEHGTLCDTYDQTGKILDVGIMTNNYYPYHTDDILKIMENKPKNWNELDGRRIKCQQL